MYLKSAALLLISVLLFDGADAVCDKAKEGDICSDKISKRGVIAGCSRVHTIVQGNICWKLWRENRLTEHQFHSINPGIDCFNLRVGDPICLWSPLLNSDPALAPTPSMIGDCSNIHTIHYKDTCWDLWHGARLSEKSFYFMNPNIDCYKLYEGDKLCLGSPSSPKKTKKRALSKTINVCHSYTEHFKDASRIVSEENYKGNPKTADWVDISGDRKTWHLGPQGLEMRVLSPGKVVTSKGRNDKVGQGATLNSTYELNYGSIEAKIKMSPVPGIVTAFITMSDGNDEVDWEWVGGDLKRAQSNYFYQGIPDYTKSKSHAITTKGGPPVDNSKVWSTFRLELQPDYLRWYINGDLVRTVLKNATVINGKPHFPSQKTRVQIGIWDSSDNADTAKWANGPVNWNSLGSYVSAYIQYIKIECDPRYNKVIP